MLLKLITIGVTFGLSLGLVLVVQCDSAASLPFRLHRYTRQKLALGNTFLDLGNDRGG